MNPYDNHATPPAPTAPAATLPQTTAGETAPPAGGAGGTQVVFVQVPRLKRSFEAYAGRWAYVLGWVQIGAGVMSIILGIANPLTCGLYGMVGIGIWGGLLYITAGIFGILSSNRKTSHTIVTHLVLTVIGVLCAAIQLALSAAAAYYDNLVYGCYYYDVVNEDSINYAGTVGVDALLVVFAVVQGVAALLASAISCKVVCCSNRFTTETGAPYDMQNGQGMPVAFPGGSVMFCNVPNSTNQFAHPYLRNELPAQQTGYGYDVTPQPNVQHNGLSLDFKPPTGLAQPPSYVRLP